MMTEEGTIKKIISNKASVLVHRSSMCESCDQKAECGTITSNKDVEIEALNTAGGKIGDRVIVSMPTSSFLKITSLVYLFPVISLIAGSIAGLKLGQHYSYDPEMSSLLSGVILFVITFLIIKKIASRMGTQKKYMPEITKLLPRIVKEETD